MLSKCSVAHVGGGYRIREHKCRIFPAPQRVLLDRTALELWESSLWKEALYTFPQTYSYQPKLNNKETNVLVDVLCKPAFDISTRKTSMFRFIYGIEEENTRIEKNGE